MWHQSESKRKSLHALILISIEWIDASMLPGNSFLLLFVFCIIKKKQVKNTKLKAKANKKASYLGVEVCHITVTCLTVSTSYHTVSLYNPETLSPIYHQNEKCDLFQEDKSINYQSYFS